MSTSDRCEVCKSEALWANFFTPDGDGSDGHGPGDRWRVLCEDCGHFQDDPKPRRPVTVVKKAQKHTHLNAGGGSSTATHTHAGGHRQHAHVAPQLVKDEQTGICWAGAGWANQKEQS